MHAVEAADPVSKNQTAGACKHIQLSASLRLYAAYQERLPAAIQQGHEGMRPACIDECPVAVMVAVPTDDIPHCPSVALHWHCFLT